MVKQLAEGSRSIQNLNWEILHRQTRRGRDLTDEEVEEKKQERARLMEQREKVKQAAARKRKLEGTIVSQSERVMEHTTRESDRIIDTVTENVRAEFAASSRETLMERIAGPRGSSQETQLAINVLKEDQKKQRKAETAERKAEEKQKKKEQMLAIPLGEGDSLQDGVVLRGEVGASKLRRFQDDAEICLGAVCCRLVELGELATLQLKPLDKQQMTALAVLVESAGSVGMTFQIQAVTEKGVLNAEMVKGKLRDTAADKPIPFSWLLALRFIPSTFKLADRLPLSPSGSRTCRSSPWSSRRRTCRTSPWSPSLIGRSQRCPRTEPKTFSRPAKRFGLPPSPGAWFSSSTFGPRSGEPSSPTSWPS